MIEWVQSTTSAPYSIKNGKASRSEMRIWIAPIHTVQDINGPSIH